MAYCAAVWTLWCEDAPVDFSQSYTCRILCPRCDTVHCEQAAPQCMAREHTCAMAQSPCRLLVCAGGVASGCSECGGAMTRSSTRDDLCEAALQFGKSLIQAQVDGEAVFQKGVEPL